MGTKTPGIERPEMERLAVKFYREMFRIRRVEKEIVRPYPTDKIKSPVHLSIGQEAVSVGVCEALRRDDVVFGTYRGHALYLAKGGDLNKMMAELYGKETGCSKGKGGSMHLVETSVGVMGTSAVVGTTIPLAVGYAFAMRYTGQDRIAATFFGDGAVDEGAFHESMNFAALKGLPVLFVCENNSYAVHSHHMERHHSDNLCERARSYGMQAFRIEDGDVFRIFEVAQEVVGSMRKGGGPVFMECLTCRFREHVGPGEDFHLGYRSADEVEAWRETEPLAVLKRTLPPEVIGKIGSEVEREIADAVRFAEESPFPEGMALFEDVFKEP